MKTNLTLVTAFAASASGRVAVASDLEVYERAVTQGDLRGQVCPSMGDTGFRGIAWLDGDQSARYGSLRPASAISARNSVPMGASSVTTNVKTSKPRTGYCALSGTG